MTERNRRRASKWDLQEDPVNSPIGTKQDDGFYAKGSEMICDDGSRQEWNPSKNTDSRNSKWSDTNSTSAFKSEDDSRRPRWEEPPSGKSLERKDDYIYREFNENSKKMNRYDDDRSYSVSISPGHDGWRHRSHSRSPKRGYSRSYRSGSRSPLRGVRRSRSPPRGIRRSRSPPRGVRRSSRSRSRSPQRGFRSRSRSPTYDLKRNSDRNDRTRGGSKASSCNYLHQENSGYEDRRHSGSCAADNRETRHERGRSYGHPDSVEQDYSRDRHDSHRNDRSSELCLKFLRGTCDRGSSCRYIHEGSTVDDRGISERTHERDTKSYSGYDRRREPYRTNSIPCKFFAAGNCRNGINCRFSHESAAPNRPEGGSGDDRFGRNLGDENKSWSGSKWHDEAAYSANGSGYAANSTWEGEPGWNSKPARPSDQGWGNKATGSANAVLEERPPNVGRDHTAKSVRDEQGWNHRQTWNDNQAAAGTPVAHSTDERQDKKLGIEKDSWGGSKWGDEAAGSSNDGMGPIANSGWGGPRRNDEPADNRPADQGQRHNLSGDNKPLEAPKSIDGAADSAHERGYIANSGSDDPRLKNQTVGLRLSDEATESEVKTLCDDNGGQVGDNDENKLLPDKERSENAKESEVTNTTNWRSVGNENEVKNVITRPQPLEKTPDNINNNKMEDQNRTSGVRRNGNNLASKGVQLPTGHKEMFTFANPPSSGAERVQHLHFVNQASQSQFQVPMLSHNQTNTREVPAVKDHPTVAYPGGQNHIVSTGFQVPQSQLQPPNARQVSGAQNHPTGMVYPGTAQSQLQVPMLSQHTSNDPHHPKVGVYPGGQNHLPSAGFQVPQAQLQPPMVSHGQTSTSSGQHHPTIGMYPGGQNHPASAGFQVPQFQLQPPMYPGGQNNPASNTMVHPPVSNLNTQSQQTLPTSSPNVRSFDLNGPVEEFPSPNHQTQFHTAGTIKEASKTEQPSTQKTVTSEEVAKIQNISASLAQIFGNGQQLPQLYATLNSATNPLGLVPPQSNQDNWSQKQYGPLSNSMASSQSSNSPPTMASGPNGSDPRKNIKNPVGLVQSGADPVGGSQSSNTPSTTASGPNVSDPRKDLTNTLGLMHSQPDSVGGSLSLQRQYDPAKNSDQDVFDKMPHHQNNEVKQMESVRVQKASDRVVKEQEVAHLGDTDADNHVDEDGKKSKDTKGMRMFKFALVEFVKEVLKPIWKEGTLSKEAHKTVVKKVIDKVTGTVGEHYPQTQDKIDQYMAYSKTKLTKLVQAYVEKYVKN